MARALCLLIVLFLLSPAYAITSEANRIGWFTGGSLIVEAGKYTNTNAPAIMLNKDATYLDMNITGSLDILKLGEGAVYYTGTTTLSLVDSNKYQRTATYADKGIWGGEIGYRHIIEKPDNWIAIGELYYKSQHSANPFSLTDTNIYDTYLIGYRATLRMGSQFYK